MRHDPSSGDPGGEPELSGEGPQILNRASAGEPRKVQLRLAGTRPGASARDGAFKQRAKLDIVDVQYKGIAPVVQDVVAGQIPMAPIDTVVILPHLRAGKLRALASFSDKRLAATPDVPAMGELGYEGLDIAPIVGVGAPAKTPRDIIHKLNAQIVRAIRDPEVNAKLTGLGLEIIADTPEQFAAFLQNEGKKWLPLIRSLNIKLD